MKRKGNFLALVYREFLLCRKSLITYAVMGLIFSMIPILVILSLRYGNLATAPDYIVAQLRENNGWMLKIGAVICPCMLCMAGPESSVHDTRVRWEQFRKSTPVTPVVMAMAKYVCYGMQIVGSFVAGVAIMGLCTSLLETKMQREEIAVIALLVLCYCMFGIVAQVFIMLLCSLDKGMVATIGVAAIGVLAFPEEWKIKLVSDGLITCAAKLLPVIPILMAMILLTGFVMTVLIYTRREK